MKNKEKQIDGCAERMKKVREHFKLNQVEFAKKLGFKNPHICAIEKGERPMTKNVMISLANVFNISPTWLLLGQGNMFLNEDNDIYQDLDPAMEKLLWYCKNSQYVKHSVLGFFLRLLRTDKTVIDNDMNIDENSWKGTKKGKKKNG